MTGNLHITREFYESPLVLHESSEGYKFFHIDFSFEKEKWKTDMKKKKMVDSKI